MMFKLLNNSTLFLTKIRWCLFVFTGSVLIFFVVIMGLLRLSLPYLTGYGEDIEKLLSEELGRPVLVGKVDADWRWFSPRLKLHDVTVFNTDKRTLLTRFDEVNFEFGVVSNLLNMSFEPTVITLSGGYVHVERDKQKQLFVQGFQLSSVTDGADSESSEIAVSLPKALIDKNFHFLDMKVKWTDHVYSSKPQVFKNVNSIVEVGNENYRFVIDVDAPEFIGKSLLVKVGTEKQTDGKWLTNLYIKADAVVSEYFMKYLPLVEFELDSTFGAEVWLAFSDGDLSKVSGDISTKSLSILSKSKPGNKSWLVKKVSTQFALSKNDAGWTLIFNDLNMKQGHHNWNDVYLSAQYNDVNNALKMRCDYLGLYDLGELIINLPVNDSIKNAITKISPRGILRKTDIFIDDWSKPDNWRLKTRFSDLGATLEYNDIVLDGLSGELVLDRNKGYLLLDSQDVVFGSEFFNQPVVISNLKSNISIRRDKNTLSIKSDNVQAEIDTVDLFGRIQLDIAENTFLDFQLQTRDADAQWLNRHRTDYLFGESVAQWLSDSIVAARFKQADLMFHGLVGDFPFTNRNGILQSVVAIEDGTLKYQSGWPEINNIDARFTIDNDLVIIDQSSGNVFNSQITDTVTTIKLTDSPHVIVKGLVAAKFKDADRFFMSTPLKHDYMNLVKIVKLNGDLTTNLKLDIPLSGESLVETSGNVHVANGALTVNGTGYQISDISGDVDFKNESISSKQLKASFNKYPVLATIDTISTDTGIQTIILADFESDIDNLVPLTVDFSSLYENVAKWKLQLNISHEEAPLDPYFSLNLKSDLTKVKLNLPYPLAKSSGVNGLLALDINVYEQYSNLLFNFDDRLNLKMAWDGDFENVRSDIRVFDGAAVLPEDGIQLSANLNAFDVAKWRQTLTPVTEQFGSGSNKFSFNKLKMVAEELKYDEFVVSNVSLDGELLEHDWNINVDSSEIKGTVLVSKDFNKDKPLRIQFSKMDLTSFAPKAEAKDDIIQKSKTVRFSPVDIPPLKVTGKNFTYKKYKFERLSLETNRSRYGLTVHALDLKGENLSLKLKGSWFINRQGKEQSSFRVELNSADIGSMLSYYDFTKSLKDGEGNAVIDWQWSASPFDFDWKLVSGRMTINAEEGHFVDIEPGAGRLLGMFSLNALPQRFMLDFSDTFSEGFEFTDFKSESNFIKGDLYTKNTHIRGTSADVYFNGRIGMADKVFDQTMSVVPRISSGVSGWIAVLQGAAVGLTAYLGQKILGVDEAAKNQYHITGSWKDPIIKKMGENDGKSNENNQNTDGEEE